MQAIVLAIGKLLGSTFIEGYKAKLESDNSEDSKIAELAKREMDLDQREAEINKDYKVALFGRWYEPVNLLGYIFVAYITSAVLWDNVIFPKLIEGRWGFTGGVSGATAVYVGMIATFFLGSRTVRSVGGSIVEVIAKIIKK